MNTTALDVLELPESATRYVFVCGLHRSGTSMIAKTLAGHPLATGFINTGTIEDEGQFLQSVLPLEQSFGGVGRFGFDPRAHMTDESPFNTAANARRIATEWQRYWRPDRPIKIEKTPSTLLRMRLMQALFPDSRFIVVQRHPVANSLASIKWTEGGIFRLFEHWLHCYRIAESDSRHLDHVHWMSYEAFIANPRLELDGIARFLGLGRWTGPVPSVTDQNRRYFDLWQAKYFPSDRREIPQNPPDGPKKLRTRARLAVDRWWREQRNPGYRKRTALGDFYGSQDVVARYQDEIAAFGYSFDDLQRFPTTARRLPGAANEPVGQTRGADVTALARKA